MLMLTAEFAIGSCQVSLAIVPNHLDDCLVGAGGILVLHIEHRIDGMLQQQGPDAILQPEAGKHGRVPRCCLAVEVQFGSPPGARTVLQFHRRGPEAVAAIRPRQRRFGFDFQVSGLLKIVGVGDEIRFFLREGREGEQEGKAGSQPKGAPHDSVERFCKQNRSSGKITT